MTTSFSLGHLNKWTLFIGQFIIQSGYNLVWANTNTAAISSAKDKSNATSIVQFINVGGAVLGTFLIGLFVPIKTMLLPFAFCIIIALMLITQLKIIKNAQ